MVEHGSLVAFVTHESGAYGRLCDEHNWCRFYVLTFTFDDSVGVVWRTLASGAQLLIGMPDAWLDPHYLLQKLSAHSVNSLWGVPSPFAIVMDVAQNVLPSSLTDLHLSGEALPPHLVKRIFANGFIHLFNPYGPAECTINTHAHQVRQIDVNAASVPIGIPLPNTTGCVLQKHRTLVPIGVAGELYAGGPKVVRGYVGRADLTSEAFLWTKEVAGRIYKTGDRVRWHSDGNLEYLGRVDFQIKLNGQRIEMGEVEAVVQQANRVQDALVMLQTNTAGIDRLVAYVVPDAVVVQDVTDTCRAVLPGYMVPSSVAGLACWPLTASGKINRALLPLPTEHIDVQHSHNMQGVNQQIAEHVCSVVSSVLHLKQVHITNHFFRDLGGTSLLAVQVMNALRQEGLQFHSVRLLFKHPVLLDFVASTYDIGEPESTFDTTMSQEFVEQRRSCVCVTLICLVQVIAGTLVTLLLCVTPVALVNYLHVVVHSVVHDVGHGVGPSLAFQALVGGSLTVVGAISVLLLAVIMKWLLIGRLSPSQHRVYSCFFIRWWLSQRAISSLPVRFVCSFVRDTPILALFYSLLGARLGSNCRIAGTGLSHCAPHYASLLLCASQLSMTFPRCPSLSVPLSACSPSSLCLLLSSCRCASHCLCLAVSLTVPYAQVQVERDIQCRIGI